MGEQEGHAESATLRARCSIAERPRGGGGRVDCSSGLVARWAHGFSISVSISCHVRRFSCEANMTAPRSGLFVSHTHLNSVSGAQSKLKLDQSGLARLVHLDVRAAQTTCVRSGRRCSVRFVHACMVCLHAPYSCSCCSLLSLFTCLKFMHSSYFLSREPRVPSRTSLTW
jgi:hypothetical protein